MNSLLLVAPFVIFAVVVLFGFTGCWLPTEGTGPDIALPTTGTYETEVLNSNPIAYWRLSDPPASQQAEDEKGAAPGGHPGTYVGDYVLGEPPSLNASDPSARPARFSGGHVEIGHDPVFETNFFTVEVLVLPNLDDPPVYGTIVSNSDFSADQGWALYCSSPNPGDTDVYGYWSPQIGSGTGSGGPLVEFDPQSLGSAVHLAVTYDGSLHLYKDGEPVADFSVDYAPNTQQPIQIGAGFHGAIQEVAVYGIALAGEVITTHYLANKKP
jgi:Concanavalin A-like lectin/glucanases superfamily